MGKDMDIPFDSSIKINDTQRMIPEDNIMGPKDAELVMQIKEGDYNDNVNESAKMSMKLDEELQKAVGEERGKLREILESEDPLKKNDGTKKAKSREQLIEECELLEKHLNLPHKGIKKATKQHVEEYFVQLMEKAANKIKDMQCDVNLGKVEDVKTAQGQLMNKMKQEILTHQEEERKIHQQENDRELATMKRKYYGDFLYRANFLILASLAELSKLTEERTGVSFAGIPEIMKEREERLVEIYGQLYQENKEVIEKYGSPILLLIMENLSMMQIAMAKNVKKKLMINQQK